MKTKGRIGQIKRRRGGILKLKQPQAERTETTGAQMLEGMAQGKKFRNKTIIKLKTKHQSNMRGKKKSI